MKTYVKDQFFVCAKSPIFGHFFWIPEAIIKAVCEKLKFFLTNIILNYLIDDLFMIKSMPKFINSCKNIFKPASQ